MLVSLSLSKRGSFDTHLQDQEFFEGAGEQNTEENIWSKRKEVRGGRNSRSFLISRPILQKCYEPSED
jgi:hypothetical protein